LVDTIHCLLIYVVFLLEMPEELTRGQQHLIFKALHGRPFANITAVNDGTNSQLIRYPGTTHMVQHRWKTKQNKQVILYLLQMFKRRGIKLVS
jgi:hypothetical protein